MKAWNPRLRNRAGRKSRSARRQAAVGLGFYTDVLCIELLEVRTLLAAQPDLSVTAASDGVTSVQLNDSLTVNWTVKNQGTAAASGNWNDSLYLSTTPTYDSSAQYLGQFAVNNNTPLAVGASYSEQESVPLPYYVVTGAQYLLVITNSDEITDGPGNGLVESNYANDVYSIPIDVTQPDVDLQVTAASPTPSTFVIGQNETGTVNYTVTNEGTDAAGGTWQDGLLVSSTNTINANNPQSTATFLGGFDTTTPLAGGASYQASINFNLASTNLTPGTYYLFVITDVNGVQSDVNFANTASAPMPITVLAPDLTVTTASSQQSTVALGQSVSISWSVQNIGGAVNSVFEDSLYDAVYVSSSPTFDSSAQYIGDFRESTHIPIATGGGYSDTENITLPSTATGARYLIIDADQDNALHESNLTNNTFAIPITITSPALTLTTATAPTAAVAGDNVPVSWTVQNEGNGSATQYWEDEVYVSPDNVLDSKAVGLASFVLTPPLAVGASYTEQQNVTLPTTNTGPEYLLIVADAGQSQPEAITSSVFVLPIDVSAAQLTTSNVTAPAAGTLGQTIPVNWTVTNKGTGSADLNWSDAIYLSQSSTFDSSAALLTTVPVGSNSPLAPGANYQGSAQVALPFTATNSGGSFNLASGTYYIFVEADYGQAQPVTTTSGATAVSASIAVVLPTLPDLVATNVTAPASGYSAQGALVSWTDKNQGAASATGPWVDTVYWSSNAQGANPVYAGTFTIPGPLAAGASSVPISGEVPLPATPGQYWLVVTTNSNGAVVEGPVNSLNDTTVASSPITVAVLPLPDLVVTSITPPLNGVLSGTSVPISFTVKNQGTAPTSVPQWQDFVVLSQDPTLINSYQGTLDISGPTGDRALINQPVVMGFNNASYLGVGQSYTQTVNLSLPLTAQGTWYVYVVPDGTGAHNLFSMPELSRSDKLALSSSFTVALNPPPDLAVTNVQAAPQEFSGQNTTVNWTVSDVGSGPVVASEPSWTDQVYLSTSNVTTSSSTLLGTFTEGSALAAGASYSDSRSVSLPAGISGTYYLLVSTNSNAAVFENGDVSDNVLPSAPITVNLTPPPDLTTTLTTVPTSAQASHAITFTYNVTNTGAGSAPNDSWTDSYFLSPTSTFHPATAILLGNQSQASPLSADASYTPTVTETLPNGLSGTYYLFAEADSGGAVFELPGDEADRISAPVAVQITSLPANLAVTTVQAPTAAASGGSALVNWTVTNQGIGDTAVSDWEDEVFAEQTSSLDSNGILLGSYEHIGLLSAGSSYSQSEQVPIPISLHGAYNLFVVTNLPTELENGPPVYQGTGTVNNTSAATPISFVQALADLQVTSVGNVPTVAAGQTITANWTVQNSGVGATNSNYWFDDVWLSTNTTVGSGGTDIYLSTLQHSNPLAAGGSYNASLSVLVPTNVPVGSYHLVVTTDRPVTPPSDTASTDELVFESNFANNQTAESGTTNVTLGSTPQLTVSSVTVPATGAADQPLAVSWTVTNSGIATGNVPIKDSVYLSADQIFDPHNVRYLGTFTQSGGLAGSASYQQSVQVTIPPGVAGTYYVFVQTDSDSSIFENSTAGQVAMASQPVSIALLPPVDLVAGTVTVPAAGVAGQNITISYQVINGGSQAANGSWSDALYLSSTPTWSASDPLLGVVQESRTLASGDNYTGTLTAPLPGVGVGSYYVIVRSNILDTLAETTLSNNLSASLTQTSIGVPALTLGTPTAGTLANQQSAYYQVTVAAGQTLQISFASQAGNSFNQLFASFGAVPSRSQADFSAQSFAANQTITVPVTQTGTYYILAYGSSVPTSPESYAITAAVIPFSVAAVSPSTIGNSGDATLEITGAKFDRATTFQLLSSTNALVASSAAVLVTDAATAYATFNLADVSPGTYTLQAKHADGTTAVLPGAVIVQPGTGSELQTFVSVPSKVLHGGISSFTVTYRNTGDADMAAPLLTLVSPTSTPFGFTPSTLQYNVPLTFLGVSSTGPAGILRPGESVSQTFSFQSSATVGTAYQFNLQVVTDSDTRPIDWTAVESRIALSVTESPNYPTILADLQTRLGSTWGNYVAALAAQASLMPSNSDLGSNNNEYDVLNLLVMQAEADSEQSVVGQLVDNDPSQPLGGLTVYATDNSTYNATTFSGITLNDGSFVVLPIDAGTYQIRVDGAALATNPSVTVASGQSVTGVILTAVPSFSLSGAVTDAITGDPVTNLAVQAIGADGSSYNAQVTGNQYIFTGLTAQAYSLVTNADGEARSETQYTIAGSSAVNNLTLTAGASISGVVSGGTVGGALYVSANPSGSNSGTLLFTDQSTDGSFNLTGLAAGSYDVQFSEAGFVPLTITVVVAAGQNLTLNSVKLTAGAQISGTFYSEITDDSVAGAEIGLYQNGGLVSFTAADSGGNFSFSGVIPGSYDVSTVGINDALITETPVTVTSGQKVTGVAIGALVGATIQGVVSTNGGANSLPYAYVTLTLPDGTTEVTSTTANGIYVFSHLYAGTYTVSIGDGTSKTITIVGADGEADEVDLQSDAVASISGQLLLSNGQPDVGGSVTLLQNGHAMSTALSASNGAFVFYVPAGGTYGLAAQSGDASYAIQSGIVVATGQAVVQNVVAGSASVTFQVTGAGSSAADTVVTIAEQTSSGLLAAGTAVVDSSGSVTFPNLVAGKYTVSAISGSNLGIDTSITLAAGSQQSDTLALVTQYSYSGVVKDSSGNPIANATVVLVPTIGGSTAFPDTTTTAADGSFSVANVTSANYNVSVFADGYQGVAMTSVAVGSSTTTQSLTLPPVSSSVTGTVVVAGNNEPVPDAQVQLLSATNQILGQAFTNSSGQFSIAAAAQTGAQLVVTQDQFLSASFFASAMVTNVTVPSQQTIQLPLAPGGGQDPPPDPEPIVILTPTPFTVPPTKEAPPPPADPPPPPTIPDIPPAQADTTIKPPPSPFPLPDETLKPPAPPPALIPPVPCPNCQPFVDQVNQLKLQINKVGNQEISLQNDIISEIVPLLGAAAHNGYDFDIRVTTDLATLLGIDLGAFGAVTSVIAGEEGIYNVAITNADDPLLVTMNFDNAYALIAKADDVYKIDNKSEVGFLPLAGVGAIAYRDLGSALSVNPYADTQDLQEKLDAKAQTMEGLAQNLARLNRKLQLAEDALNNCEQNFDCGNPQAPNPKGNNGGGGGGASAGPKDPNTISGPTGFGSANFVSVAQPLSYQIDFENEPTASLPAQQVTVTEQLDTNLNWQSFRLGNFGFGGTTYTVPANTAFYTTQLNLAQQDGFDVDVTGTIDESTGVATWTFTTIDPATGQIPLDPTIGFLPADTSDGIGEGFVSYTIEAKPTDTTGTVINAQASVDFYTQPPLDTPQIFNTIDSGAGLISVVAPLSPTQTSPQINVSWSGSDSNSGSAIAAYNLYVSVDGGPFAPWLTDTTQTSGTYVGQVGHTYAFISQALDNVGNLEPFHSQADTSTSIQGQSNNSTTTMVSSSHASGSTYGQTVQFTATVSGGTGTPTGSVQFEIDSIDVGSPEALSGGIATFSTSALTATSHTITAVYTSNSTDFENSHGEFDQAVAPAPLTVTASSPSKVYGAMLPALSFTTSAFVNGDTAATALTGALSTTATAASPVASYPISQGTLAAANYTITFVAGSLSITPAPLKITADNKTKEIGATDPPLTFTAATFVNGDTASSLTTQPTLSTTATTSSPVGSYPITVSGAVDPNYKITYVSGTLTVTAAGTATNTTLSSNANPAMFGQRVTFVAFVSPAGGSQSKPTGSVTFMDGTTVLGTGNLTLVTNREQATFSTSSLAVGKHSITAIYAANGKFLGSTSRVVSEVIDKATTTTTLSASPTSPVVGQQLTLTTTVAVVKPGAGIPTGTVTFKTGTTTLGTGTLSVVGGKAQTSITISSAKAGTFPITEVYHGDGNFSGSTSTTAGATVQKAATTTTLTSSLNPATSGHSVTFTATLAVVSPGAGKPTGMVTFKAGTTTLGTGTLSTTGGVTKATFSISSLAVGSHSITAVYGGDTNFKASTSAALSEKINAAPAAIPVASKPASVSTAALLATGGTSVNPAVAQVGGSSAVASAASSSKPALPMAAIPLAARFIGPPSPRSSAAVAKAVDQIHAEGPVDEWLW
jgi:hypothetical protein